MKFSDGEKFIAFMLADLIAALKVDSEIDPDFVKSAIAGDDLWALKWKYSGLFHNEGPDQAIVDEATRIMSMCRVVESSIDQLPEQEKATIPERDRICFVGFDGNEEPHFGVATMLVNSLDRYAEWASRPLNSHHSTLGRYRRMLAAFDQQDFGYSGRLTREQIEAVLAA